MKKPTRTRRLASVAALAAATVGLAAGSSAAVAIPPPEVTTTKNAQIWAHTTTNGGMTLTARVLRVVDNVVDEARTQKIYWKGWVRNPCGYSEYVDQWVPTPAVVEVFGVYPEPGRNQREMTVHFELDSVLNSNCSGIMRPYPLYMSGTMRAYGWQEETSPSDGGIGTETKFSDTWNEYADIAFGWGDFWIPPSQRFAGQATFKHLISSSTRID